MDHLFDDQAASFDKRAGLPEGLADRIATALADLATENQCRRLMEVGPGTGELGLKLVDRFLDYWAIDYSLPMLMQFRARSSQSIGLVQADANDTWPFREGALDFVFGARSLHHIRPEHILSEMDRMRRDGPGLLVMGQKLRGRDSPSESLRRRLHEVMKSRGLLGHGKEKWLKKMRSLVDARGDISVKNLVVHEWTTSWTPRLALSNWGSKKGLAGLELSMTLQREILDELLDWASREYGDLDSELSSPEKYQLEVFTFDKSGAPFRASSRS
jgi:ubiquinone/menaquinone biosynthesis C-methylase UbiE